MNLVLVVVLAKGLQFRFKVIRVPADVQRICKDLLDSDLSPPVHPFVILV